MAKSDCPDRGALEDYLQGRLEQVTAQAIDEHLESCEVCEDTVQNLESDTDLRVKIPAVRTQSLPGDDDYGELIGELRKIRPASSASNQVEQDSTDSLVGSTLREYKLLELIDKGGMGAVYKAEHTSLGRTVAIKVLPEASLKDEALVKRFQREMKAVGRLDHPNIVRATDAGHTDGTHFLAMEFVDGPNLTRLVRHVGPLGVADACELIRQAATALQVAHEAGLVHRDIKPSNLMLTANGQVKVLDLGLALLDDEQLDHGHTDLTSHSQIMGTADYMAPEQAIDTHSVDIRADVYSLGCTLFFLLTGRPPFRTDKTRSTLQTLMAHANDPVPKVLKHRKDIPKKLGSLVSRLLAKQPADRPTPPGEVASLLATFCKGADLVALLNKSTEPVAEETIAVSSTETGLMPQEQSLPPTLDHADVPTTIHKEKKTTVRRTTSGARFPIRIAILAAGVILLTLGAIVFRILTNNGVFSVEVADDSVAAKLTQSGIVVEDSDSDRTWRIRAGESMRLPTGKYHLQEAAPAGLVLHILDDTGAEFETSDFTIRRGGRIVLRVAVAEVGDAERLDLSIASRENANDIEGDDEWTQLFNGRDLTGWKVQGDAHWQVEGHAITVNSSNSGALVCMQPFDNFELELDVFAESEANGGVWIHAGDPESLEYTGYEIQVAGSQGDPGQNYTGGLYAAQLAFRQAANASLDNCWVRLRVKVEGSRIRTWVNGVGTADYSAARDRLKGGYLALQSWCWKSNAGASSQDDQSSMLLKYKNVRIREVTDINSRRPATEGLKVSYAGWQALFNNEGLRGTVKRDDTQAKLNAQSRILDLDRGPITSLERFTDFELRLDFRLSLESVIEVALRSNVEPWRSPKIRLSSVEPSSNHAFFEKRDHASETLARLKLPSHQWHQLRLVVVGQAVEGFVDGEPSFQATIGTEQHAAHPEGPLALLSHIGRNQFRNVRVLPLLKQDGVASTAQFSSLAFDGVQDYVHLPTVNYGGTYPITIEAWATPTFNTHSSMNVVCDAQSRIGGFNLGTSKENENWRCQTINGSKVVGLETPLQLQHRAHVALTIDRSTAKFFVNGKLKVTENISYRSSKNNLRIGGLPRLESGAHFAGLIDEVRISKVVRYDENFQPGDHFETDSDTIALYHFDEGNGDVLLDSSGNEHHGKIVGATWVRAGGGNSTRASDGLVDILSQINLNRDKVSDRWSLFDGVLTGSGPFTEAKPAVLELPGELKGNYQLDIGFTRLQAAQSFNVNLPVGNRSVTFILDGFPQRGGGFTGLQRLDDKGLPDSPEAIKSIRLKTGQRYLISFDVQVNEATAKIETRLDGAELVSWQGNINRLAPSAIHAGRNPAKPSLSVFQATYDFDQITLRTTSEGLSVTLDPKQEIFGLFEVRRVDSVGSGSRPEMFEFRTNGTFWNGNTRSRLGAWSIVDNKVQLRFDNGSIRTMYLTFTKHDEFQGESIGTVGGDKVAVVGVRVLPE